MSQPSNAGAVVVDANVLISLCTKEPLTFAQADAAFNDYGQRGWTYHAPNAVVSETLFILCHSTLSIFELVETTNFGHFWSVSPN